MRKKSNYAKTTLLLFIVLWILGLRSPALAQTPVAPEITITLDALTGLQFDKARFQVKPGARVRIVLANTDDMSHNMLITKPGARLEVVLAAQKLGDTGPSVNYIPKSPQVMWAIPVVAPNETKSVEFTAPKEEGIYPYVCTLPGHGYIMYGAMYVTSENKLPPLKNDVNIPPARRTDPEPITKTKPDNTKVTAVAKDAHDEHTPKAVVPMHPYTPVAPYFYRVFIDGASPAAIAVSLPKDNAYCWDAGTCRLRFAWYGGFLDNSELWRGKGDVSAKVIGTVFYRDKTEYPLRVGKPDKLPQVDYKGFKLINRYPEFEYTIDGLDVFELITPKEDGTGLVRTFRIPQATKNIYFCFSPEDGALYEFSTGKWEASKLVLSAKQAHSFTITMTRRKGVSL